MNSRQYQFVQKNNFKTGQVDVHVLCGVIKDFMGKLREPLVPCSMWVVFTSAASNPDSTDGESDLFQAVSELPQPNRDTMAFLMLHLQKVAAAKETKMTRSNLAKILGPTLIGYSSMEPEPEIMREVGQQTATMEKLLGIDSDYCSTFLGDEGEELYRDCRLLSPGTPEAMSIFR
jgi:Rac GTPase-activating protein 1